MRVAAHAVALRDLGDQVAVEALLAGEPVETRVDL
jgi:hypothetical protein